MKKGKKEVLDLLSKYFLIMYVFSFLGWLFEVIQSFIFYNSFSNRGFLSSPICPIYGLTIMFIYFCVGTPFNPKGLIKGINSLPCVFIIYFLISFIMPTIMELLIGLSFEEMFNVRLWDYSYLPYNNAGYISLIISLGWAVLITLVMTYIFPFVQKKINLIPYKYSVIISIILFFLILIDLIYNVSIFVVGV